MRRWFSLIAFWGACLGILTATLLPTSQLPPLVFSVSDKLQHAAAFALLYCLGQTLYAKQRLKLVLGLLLFGAAIELAQSAIGWRTGDWYDWLADATGLALAAWVAIVWNQAYPKIRLRASSALLHANSLPLEPALSKREGHPPKP
ncbi:MAG: VanZ family protein [Burkholderiales bacterium]|jgi:VanZ family protein